MAYQIQFTDSINKGAIIVEDREINTSDTSLSIPKNSFPTEEVFQKYNNEFREFCESMQDGSGEWCDKITQEELDALRERGRVSFRDEKNFTLEEVNRQNRTPSIGSHDAINRGILIDARLKRFGIPKMCPDCEGHGHIFTEPQAHLNLILWVIHPRKGASRGVEVKNIKKTDMPKVFKYLREARQRNHDRFFGISEEYEKITKEVLV